MGVRKSDVDDGLTFAYLYAHPDVEVLGITCTFANNNEHVVYYNTLQMLEDLEITDVPVLKGGRTPGNRMIVCDFAGNVYCFASN